MMPLAPGWTLAICRPFHHRPQDSANCTQPRGRGAIMNPVSAQGGSMPSRIRPGVSSVATKAREPLNRSAEQLLSAASAV